MSAKPKKVDQVEAVRMAAMKVIDEEARARKFTKTQRQELRETIISTLEVERGE